jgi:hypothetical protein
MADGASKDLERQRFHLLFGVRRSIRYHLRRRSFFETWNTLTQALAVIFGSAAIGGALKEGYALLAIVAAALVTIFSAVNLVVGTTRKARLHEELSKRFFALERELIEAGDYDVAALAKFKGKRLEIEADEPPILKVLDCVCHNELLRALGYEREQFLSIGPVQRLLRHFFDFREHTILRQKPSGTPS